MEIEGERETVHVKNTGRCRELLREGVPVILEESANQNRKTRYSLIAVYKGTMLVNMDSQAPNAAAAEALREGRIAEIGQVDFLKREVAYAKSRFDLYYERGGQKGFLEVKGVTLEEDGIAMFPDAPTERGARHVRELIEARREGLEAGILFLVQMEKAGLFRPNGRTDPAFAEALTEAKREGVQILAYTCRVEPDKMTVWKSIPTEI